MDKKEDYYFWIMFLLALNNMSLNEEATAGQETILETLDTIRIKLDSIESQLEKLKINE